MKRIRTLLFITILVFSNVITVFAENNSVQTVSADTSKTDSTSNKIIWPKGPSVVAESAVVIEATTGVILYKKNKDDQHYPASITKILTTLLALENSSLSETITFSKDAVYGIEVGSSSIGAMVGEELTMEQCLYAIMLESANEVSSAVAEHIAGSTAKFADMMNAKAKELGCKNTNFVNANGLHNDNHYTTAYDMALISQAAMKNSTFRTITSTKRFTIPITNKYKEIRYLCNHQQMLYANKYPQYKYDGCIGGKTGYTQKAGNTLVTFAKRGDMELICIVMKSTSPALSANQYTDTSSLLDFAFNNYSIYNIASSNDNKILENNLLFSRYNCLFNEEVTPLKICGTGNVVLPKTATLSDATQNVELFKNITIKDGENKIGSISYTYGDRIVGSTDITYNKTLSPMLVSKSTSIKNNQVGYGLHTIAGTKDLKPLIIFGIIVIIIIVLTLAYCYLRFWGNGKRLHLPFHRRKNTSTFDHNFMDFKP